MKKSIKGALLSGLLFPGAGQLWLRCYLRGVVLIVLVTGCLAAVAKRAGQQAFAIVERMEAEGGTVDMVALFRSLADTPADHVITTVTKVLVLVWVVGILDAYLAGRKKDRS